MNGPSTSKTPQVAPIAHFDEVASAGPKILLKKTASPFPYTAATGLGWGWHP